MEISKKIVAFSEYMNFTDRFCLRQNRQSHVHFSCSYICLGEFLENSDQKIYSPQKLFLAIRYATLKRNHQEVSGIFWAVLFLQTGLINAKPSQMIRIFFFSEL